MENKEEKCVEFRPGFYYQHKQTKAVMLVHREIDTWFYGRCFIAEDQKGFIRPLSMEPEAGIGWELVRGWPESVYVLNRIKKTYELIPDPKPRPLSKAETELARKLREEEESLDSIDGQG